MSAAVRIKNNYVISSNLDHFWNVDPGMSAALSMIILEEITLSEQSYPF